MIIIYLFLMKTLIVVWFRSVPSRRLYRSVTRRLFLAASKMAGMDVNMCAEMLWIDTMRVDVELCRRYVNVALNKPTDQQFPYKPGDDTYDSSNAVDGLKADLTLNGGQCVYSEPNRTATWWVNLTSIHSIHHITIYFMTGTYPWGPSNPYTSSFLGFSLYVSNTTDMSQGILCFKDRKFSTRTIPAVFTTNCSMPGQYVIYYNERLMNVSYPKKYSPFVQSNLCEVEVYECSPGNYGINCLQKCGECRGKSPCNKINGSCPDGCSAGYIGSLCSEQCSPGNYGINCLQKCGECRGKSPCNKINGSCPDGCSAGYIGSLCSEHCKETFYGKNCALKCSKNCTHQRCHHVTGVCNPDEQSNYMNNRTEWIVFVVFFYCCRRLLDDSYCHSCYRLL
ncbi:uncharacterized protein LOC128173778 isoform X1 [Crassostrea angulata]|uniref:uncharacterized protein LOC128173778 isoform X1 n=1 Tax=Magallana angulata TaxID=2784310 RepID=UPI0022B1FC42|nr:uncharacterized protein LOC128173778 isoform X1 [Crassostrea angulata]XP_052695409.1 uncharacterized protein LOC128173778 isoform X1 [Crassostrea angulata]